MRQNQMGLSVVLNVSSSTWDTSGLSARVTQTTTEAFDDHFMLVKSYVLAHLRFSASFDTPLTRHFVIAGG